MNDHTLTAETDEHGEFYLTNHTGEYMFDHMLFPTFWDAKDYAVGEGYETLYNI